MLKLFSKQKRPLTKTETESAKRKRRQKIKNGVAIVLTALWLAALVVGLIYYLNSKR